jgi:hypothetical protein
MTLPLTMMVSAYGDFAAKASTNMKLVAISPTTATTKTAGILEIASIIFSSGELPRMAVA